MNFCHIFRYGLFVTMVAIGLVTSLRLCIQYGQNSK